MFLKISQNSQESTCARVFFKIKLQAWDLQPATLLKRRLWHRCFLSNFAKFFRAPFYLDTSAGCFRTVVLRTLTVKFQINPTIISSKTSLQFCSRFNFLKKLTLQVAPHLFLPRSNKMRQFFSKYFNCYTCGNSKLP